MSPKQSESPRCCPVCDREYEPAASFCSYDGAALVTARPGDVDPMLGRVLAGRFRIERRLGAGGMGRVYLAQQLRIGRPVAIKVLRADRATEPRAEKRFLNEARAMSVLTSPHTVTVHDFGKAETGELFLAMEYLEGRTLRSALSEAGRFSLGRAAAVLEQVADSLAEAHARGVVHRDLKPDNVFLARTHASDEYVKVLDFGIARMLEPIGDDAAALTSTGDVPGTPLYLSPEAIAGEEVGPPADVYALGLLLFELLAGRPPFSGRNAADLLRAHVQDQPPELEAVAPGSSSPALQQLLWRCLAKQPELRPADAAAFRAALREAVGRSEGPAQGGAAASTTDEAAVSWFADTRSAAATGDERSTRAAWWAYGGVLLVIGVVLVWSTFEGATSREPPSDPASVATAEAADEPVTPQPSAKAATGPIGERRGPAKEPVRQPRRALVPAEVAAAEATPPRPATPHRRRAAPPRPAPAKAVTPRPAPAKAAKSEPIDEPSPDPAPVERSSRATELEEVLLDD